MQSTRVSAGRYFGIQKVKDPAASLKRLMLYSTSHPRTKENEIRSSEKICSFLRTSALRGKRYPPDCLSGNMDVFHVVLPIVTVTGIEPQPRLGVPKDFFISSDCFLGTAIKCHPAMPGYRKTFDLILKTFKC